MESSEKPAENVTDPNETSGANHTALREKRHFKLLKNALDKTVEKCTGAARFSLFAKSYPSLTKENPKALKCIQQQFKKNLKELLDAELETMFHEEMIPEFLSELDDLTDGASKQREHSAWRPSGVPAEDLRHHLVPIKLKQKAQLEKLLASLEEENAKLRDACLSQRQLLKSKSERCSSLIKEPPPEVTTEEEIALLKEVEFTNNPQ